MTDEFRAEVDARAFHVPVHQPGQRGGAEQREGEQQHERRRPALPLGFQEGIEVSALSNTAKCSR